MLSAVKARPPRLQELGVRLDGALVIAGLEPERGEPVARRHELGLDGERLFPRGGGPRGVALGSLCDALGEPQLRVVGGLGERVVEDRLRLIINDVSNLETTRVPL